MNRKHVVKSILSVILTMAMIFGTVQLPFAPESVVVHADEEPTIVASGNCGDNGDNVTWLLDNTGKLTISGSGAMADYNHTTSRVPWDNATITSVVIENGVTSIGNYAFENCSGLTSITIPDSVKTIGGYAFSGCSKLTTITIPDSVTSIGDSAFECCDSLTTITIPDGVISIGDEAFRWCDNLNTVVIGSGVGETGVEVDAFINCDILTTVYAPAGITIPNVDESKIKRYSMLVADDNNTAAGGAVLSGTTSGTLTIADGAIVTLVNATISGGIICEGDATIILAGKNTVNVSDIEVEDRVNGYGHAGIYVPIGNTLTIKGTGMLNVKGGERGAGIGANEFDICGYIKIEGGIISAIGGKNAAGIGAANKESTDIEIAGGIVTAEGGDYAAGIGGGAPGSVCGNIIISGGTVNAKGGIYAAGIGCGHEGDCGGDILISGGKITATGGNSSAGIGASLPASVLTH